jgi:hypothetical protein
LNGQSLSLQFYGLPVPISILLWSVERDQSIAQAPSDALDYPVLLSGQLV